ncbi:hypothetical protein [Streptomyces sp. NPDC007905]
MVTVTHVRIAALVSALSAAAFLPGTPSAARNEPRDTPDMATSGRDAGQ